MVRRAGILGLGRYGATGLLLAVVFALPAAAVSATEASAAPDPSVRVPKKTRQALRAAPRVIAQAYVPVLELADAVNEAVPYQIEECQEIEALELSDPQQAAERWAVLVPDAVRNANNITRAGRLAVDVFGKKATSLRAHLRALPAKKRMMLDRAIALLVDAKLAWGQFFVANAQTATYVSWKDCDEALTFRQAGRRHEDDAHDASIEGQQLLARLADSL